MKSVIAIPFRRKLSGRTNYRKRLGLLTAGDPRLIVRKTLTGIILQVVGFAPEGDKVILSVTSRKLKSLGWNHSCKNVPASYLAGLLIGKMAVAAKVTKVVPDLGLQSVTKGGKVFAALKGAKDSGLSLEVSEDVVPSPEAISGARISSYSKNSAITGDFEKVRAAIAAQGGK